MTNNYYNKTFKMRLNLHERETLCKRIATGGSNKDMKCSGRPTYWTPPRKARTLKRLTINRTGYQPRLGKKFDVNQSTINDRLAKWAFHIENDQTKVRATAASGGIEPQIRQQVESFIMCNHNGRRKVLYLPR